MVELILLVNGALHVPGEGRTSDGFVVALLET